MQHWSTGRGFDRVVGPKEKFEPVRQVREPPTIREAGSSVEGASKPAPLVWYPKGRGFFNWKALFGLRD